jgi:hypothetical protein
MFVTKPEAGKIGVLIAGAVAVTADLSMFFPI